MRGQRAERVVGAERCVEVLAPAAFGTQSA